MARLASMARMGYYPTPEELTPIICKHLERKEPGLIRIVDPCAGEGLALQVIGQHLEAETYGVELDRERGASARSRLTKCLVADYQAVLSGHGFAGLLYLNPPYDWSARLNEIDTSERYERTFLRDTIKYLAPGGILVYLIPQSRLDMKIARLLAYRFEDIRLYRFPTFLYERFKQVVIFGRLKVKPGVDDLVRDFLAEAGQGTVLVNELPEVPEYVYQVPVSAQDRKFVFRSSQVDPVELESEILSHGLFPDLEYALNPPGLTDRITALMPLRHGHMAQLIACGFVNGVVFDAKRKNPLVVKGRTKKVVETRVETEGDQEKHIETQRLVISITAFNHLGELITIK